jgi:hypothetical protein
MFTCRMALQPNLLYISTTRGGWPNRQSEAEYQELRRGDLVLFFFFSLGFLFLLIGMVMYTLFLKGFVSKGRNETFENR